MAGSYDARLELDKEIRFYEGKVQRAELILKGCEDVASEPFADFDIEHTQEIVDEAEREYQRYSARLAVAKAALDRLGPKCECIGCLHGEHPCVKTQAEDDELKQKCCGCFATYCDCVPGCDC